MAGPAEFELIPQSPALGAEIRGLDLREALPQSTIDALREAWMKYIVLVFRDQELTQEQQLAFAGRFGELGKRKTAPEVLRARAEGIKQQDRNVMLVSNKLENGKPVGSFGDGEMWFHIDSGYHERPYKFTFLYAVELPSWGGNTRFSNMYMAYDELRPELKGRLAGRKALHIHEYKRRDKVDISGDISSSPHWFHPVFITHPETGRKALFVDRLMTRRIEGLDPEESEAILEELYEHGESERYIHEHVWRLGDFVMWDNRCSIHGRTYFPEDETRLLRRCTIEGEPVFENL